MAHCESCFYYSYPDGCKDCNKGSIFREIKITNANRIRAMSDEELAIYFSGLIKDTKEYEYCDRVEDWLKWLQTETNIER